MNVTSHTGFRRRASSIDDLQQSLAQSLLLKGGPEDTADDGKDIEKHLLMPVPPPPALNGATKPQSGHALPRRGSSQSGISMEQPRRPSYGFADYYGASLPPSPRMQREISWKAVAVLVVACFVIGFCSTFMLKEWLITESEEVVEDEEASFAKEDSGLPYHESLYKRCASNSTSCPQLYKRTFAKDWITHSKGLPIDEKPCYSQEKMYDSKCMDKCELLFRKTKNESEAIKRTTLACHIGCTFAERELTSNIPKSSLDAPNCQYDCRNTVWVHVPGKMRKCNFEEGLGLVTTTFERSFGSGMFGVGKACEVGCILGNSRPCPFCDREAEELNAASNQGGKR